MQTLRSILAPSTVYKLFCNRNEIAVKECYHNSNSNLIDIVDYIGLNENGELVHITESSDDIKICMQGLKVKRILKNGQCGPSYLILDDKREFLWMELEDITPEDPIPEDPTQTELEECKIKKGDVYTRLITQSYHEDEDNSHEWEDMFDEGTDISDEDEDLKYRQFKYGQICPSPPKEIFLFKQNSVGILHEDGHLSFFWNDGRVGLYVSKKKVDFCKPNCGDLVYISENKIYIIVYIRKMRFSLNE